jgi:hypothetical protein
VKVKEKRTKVKLGCGLAGLGRRVRRRVGIWPKTSLKALEMVDKSFRLEFEFESFSNSNYTQIKIQINPEKPNSCVLPYFEYMFL